MGLTKQSVGSRALRQGRLEPSANTRTVALAGNPNVGKSTVFNGLTGLNQHTGNWQGKTVTTARGSCSYRGHSYTLVDIPGTYSLIPRSAEEAVARDFLCYGGADAVVVVCDATCLERNLNLVLQILEVTSRVVLCVNLLDEAKKKGITVDLGLLQARLGIPVVGTVARSKKSLTALLAALIELGENPPVLPPPLPYSAPLEAALSELVACLAEKTDTPPLPPRALALRYLLACEGCERGLDDVADLAMRHAAAAAREALGQTREELEECVVTALLARAEALAGEVLTYAVADYSAKDRRLDRLLTGRLVGYPVMLLLLAGVLWLTIVGANLPSQWLASALFALGDRLRDLLMLLDAPPWLTGALVDGVWRTLAWVVSVMLPPMAIFFPLFTLLEDAGYLPRIAYNLDRPFRRCNTCGKQALTMCMGFGCNAAGVVGCRIIDSPRERLLAILTNSLVPCNGRFPTLIALLTVFFVGTAAGLFSGALAALLLTALLLLGILATFAMTRLLSLTLLRGVPSSFLLELPPYRRPQLGRVILRSLLDRTLFVLGRAAAVAAPAGLLLWLLANLTVGDASLLSHLSAFLDPLAAPLGLDGVILLAFLLGFPANEIVIPIILMAYLAEGSLVDGSDLTTLHRILTANGWRWDTALSTMLFMLFHWPCSTTLLTIRKETGKWSLTALAALLPTALGVLLCLLLHTAVTLFGG